MITLFSVILDILEVVQKDGNTIDQKVNADTYHLSMQTFEFVFLCYLMRQILNITNDLSQILQRKDQDMFNVMVLVNYAKSRLQDMRDSGWDSLFQEVCTFCDKHGIIVPNMEDLYLVNPRRPTNLTNLHYYRVDLFYTIIDM